MASSTKEKFDAAVTVIQSLPKNGAFQPSHELMLKFYGFYKQAKLGPCNIAKPAFWDVVGKAKWDAWNKLGDMPQEEAMHLYVEELKKIIEAMPHTQMVQEFVEKLGNFYEVVEVSEDGAELSANSQSAKLKKGLQVMKKAQKSHRHDDDDENDNRPHNGPSNGANGDWSLEEIGGSVEENIIAHAYSEEESHRLQTYTETLLAEEGGQMGRSQNGHNHVNGHRLTNGGSPDGETDSEAEEFCDTSDSQPEGLPLHSDVDLPEHPQDSSSRHEGEQHSPHRTTDLEVTSHVLMMRGGGNATDNGRQSNQPADRPSTSASQRSRSRLAGGDRSEERGYGATGGASGGDRPPLPPSSMRLEVNEQIALALVRLQQDMTSVLSRLNTLEALSIAQHQVSRSRHVSDNDRNNQVWWWPFGNVSGRTVLFFLAWPVVLQCLLKLIALRRRRYHRR